jgi:hypothetical protein
MNIVEVLDDSALLGPWFEGSSWDAWRAVLKAAFALPLSENETVVFRSLAERAPPRERVRELWIIAGRRGGKDSIASAIVTHFAAFGDYSCLLRPGERALCMLLACDRDQAKIVLEYSRAYFERVEMLGAMVTSRPAGGLELDNGAEIAIHTNSFRAVSSNGTILLGNLSEKPAHWKCGNELPGNGGMAQAFLGELLHLRRLLGDGRGRPCGRPSHGPEQCRLDAVAQNIPFEFGEDR